MQDRDGFSHWTEAPVRYSDTDRQGHVNNAVFASFCETGRVTMLHLEGGAIAPSGFSFVIARLAIDFRAELRWPGVVEIGTAVRALGRTSVTLAQVLIQGGTAAARADSVLVLTDMAARRPAPLPEETRARLSAYCRAAPTDAAGP